MTNHARVCCAAVAGALLVVAEGIPGEALAAEPPTPRSESPRALNGLVFQPSRLLTSPFTTTAFGMSTLFGIGEADAPRFDINGNQVGTRSYTLAAYGQDVNLDLRLTPDISVRAAVNGLIFSGTNGRGILVAGATAQYGINLGVTAGKDLNPTMRLALVADIGSEPQLSVLVGNAVLNAIQNGTFDESGLFSTVNRLKASPGVSFAWALTPAVGFLAEGRYIWTRRTGAGDGTERTAQGVSAGGLVTLDLDPIVRWPFAIQASYRGDFPVGNDGIAEVHQTGAGFYYSRRPQLALGLEVDWRHGAIRPGVEPTLKADAALGSIWFRYYW